MLLTTSSGLTTSSEVQRKFIQLGNAMRCGWKLQKHQVSRTLCGKSDLDRCSRTRDILFFIPHVLLPRQNLVPTFSFFSTFTLFSVASGTFCEHAEFNSWNFNERNSVNQPTELKSVLQQMVIIWAFLIVCCSWLQWPQQPAPDLAWTLSPPTSPHSSLSSV